jgi:hypothetical protein
MKASRASLIAVTMGVTSLLDLFKEEYYSGLEGGILEAFGKLFTKNMRIYVYPRRDPATGVLQTAGNMAMPEEQRDIFEHLVKRGRIKAIENFDESVLPFFPAMCCKGSRTAVAGGRRCCPRRLPL